MDNETRDKIRMAISGQKEEPVTLETGSGELEDHGPPAGGQDGGGLTVSPDEVMVELHAYDPQLTELLALRAVAKRLTARVAELEAG